MAGTPAGAQEFFSEHPSPYFDSEQRLLPEVDTTTRNTAHHDIELNFLVRLILERGYSHVVEIGAWKCNRVADLRRLLPDVQTTAVDLTFQRDSRQGIEFCAYSDLPGLVQPGALIFASSTLAPMTLVQLQEFAGTAAACGADIAFVEPDLPLGVNRTIRRSPLSFYHDYKSVFGAAGYVVTWENDTDQKTNYDVLISVKSHTPDVWRMGLATLQ